MTRPQFKHPREMEVEEDRTPISTRVKVSTKAILERAAKEKKGLSLSKLIADVLDNYAAWIDEESGKKK